MGETAAKIIHRAVAVGLPGLGIKEDQNVRLHLPIPLLLLSARRFLRFHPDCDVACLLGCV